MMTALQVALGGAIGATLRWLLGVAMFRLTGPGFPVAVMTANVIGSFIMGFFVVLAARKGLNHMAPFVMTGLLGGFTTFSAFSLETVNLWERGDTAQVALYVALSVGLSIGALFLGLLAAREIWP